MNHNSLLFLWALMVGKACARQSSRPVKHNRAFTVLLCCPATEAAVQALQSKAAESKVGPSDCVVPTVASVFILLACSGVYVDMLM